MRNFNKVKPWIRLIVFLVGIFVINEITCVHLALCLALGEEEAKKVKTISFQEIRIELAAAKAHMHIKEKETKNNDIHGA